MPFDFSKVFEGLSYEEWHDVFMKSCVAMTFTRHLNDAIAVLTQGYESNIFYLDENKRYHYRFLMLGKSNHFDALDLQIK